MKSTRRSESRDRNVLVMHVVLHLDADDGSRTGLAPPPRPPRPEVKRPVAAALLPGRGCPRAGAPRRLVLDLDDALTDPRRHGRADAFHRRRDHGPAAREGHGQMYNHGRGRGRVLLLRT